MKGQRPCIVGYRSWLQRATVVVLGGFAAPAVADPLKSVAIRLDAPSGCPDQVALTARLRRDLEGSQPSGEALTFHVAVENGGTDIWHAVVRTLSHAGPTQRVLSARTCEALLDATSLIIATVIAPESTEPTHHASDPTATRHAPSDDASNGDASSPPSPTQPATPTASVPPTASAYAPSPTQPATPTATASVPSASSAPSASPPALPTSTVPPIVTATQQPKQSTTRDLVGLLAAWAAIDSGSLPAFTPVFGGAIGLLRGPLRAEATFGWWWPRDASIDRGSTLAAGGTFGLMGGSVRGCFRLLGTRGYDLSPCGGFELARWTGEGDDSLKQRQQTSLWGASIVPAAMGVVGVTRSLALRANIDVPIVFSRPVFRFNDGGTPHEVFGPNRASIRIGAGVELRFR